MRAKLFQINWHPDPEKGQNLPIYSIDVHPSADIGAHAHTLATGGADKEIKIWRVVNKGEQAGPGDAAKVDVEFAFAISALEFPVNAVRFSPNGQCLAAGLDGGHVMVFYPKPEYDWNTVQLARHLNRVRMNPSFGCKGHSGDVYDIAWSPDSRFLVSGAVDNSAVIWDVAKETPIHRLEGHTQYIQGVAWDPCGTFIATESNDRSVRVYRAPASKARGSAAATWSCAQVINKREQTGSAATAATAAAEAPTSTAAGAASAEAASSGSSAPAAAPAALAVKHHMFADEGVVSFFRRPTWTPDGTLLMTPTGLFKVSGGAAAAANMELDSTAGASKGIPTTYIFARDKFQAPVAHFPGTSHSKASICVRVSPVLYTLRTDLPASQDTGSARPTSPALEGSAGAEQLTANASDSPASNGAFILPYRMYAAVATLDSVLIYDTQQRLPVAVLAGFHVDKITDMAWSPNGEQLFIASIDGYVSCASFAPAELGTPLSLEALPAACKHVHEPTFAPKAKTAGAGGAETSGDVGAADTGAATGAAAASAEPGVATLVPRKRTVPAAVPTTSPLSPGVSMLAVPAMASPPRNPSTEPRAAASTPIASPGKRRIAPVLLGEATEAAPAAAAPAPDASAAELTPTKRAKMVT